MTTSPRTLGIEPGRIYTHVITSDRPRGRAADARPAPRRSFFRRPPQRTHRWPPRARERAMSAKKTKGTYACFFSVRARRVQHFCIFRVFKIAVL
jgi:hypothetical protein